MTYPSRRRKAETHATEIASLTEERDALVRQLSNTSADYKGAYGRQIGEKNREAIEKVLKDCPGIRNKEIAKVLDIRVETVGKHINRIRDTWLCPTKSKQ